MAPSSLNDRLTIEAVRSADGLCHSETLLESTFQSPHRHQYDSKSKSWAIRVVAGIRGFDSGATPIELYLGRRHRAAMNCNLMVGHFKQADQLLSRQFFQRRTHQAHGI